MELSAAVPNLKTMGEGVAVVEEDGVISRHSRPAFDGRDDGIMASHFDRTFDATPEYRSDDALVDEWDAVVSQAHRIQHGKNGARPGAAG